MVKESPRDPEDAEAEIPRKFGTIFWRSSESNIMLSGWIVTCPRWEEDATPSGQNRERRQQWPKF